MQSAIEYIVRNKEWIFDGIGVMAISCIGGLLYWLFTHRKKSGQKRVTHVEDEGIPQYWYGIFPRRSSYEFTTETASSLPIDEQSFSFEYGPQGHAAPLSLKNARVRADIQFTCRVRDLSKVFGASEYPLNVLQPRFLTQARDILEGYSLAKLRAARQKAAADILARLKPQFEKLGFSLDSVTIGALEKLDRAA